MKPENKTDKRLRTLLMIYGVLYFSCTFMPITGILARMSSGGNGIGGRPALISEVPEYMGKIHLTPVLVLLLITLMTGCGAKEKPEDMFLFRSGKIVGKDIPTSDITDFYYTEENINYDAYYQRYRFYVEDGKHLFFHETRERRNNYGPCTEDDTTLIGTIELTDEQWSQFADLVNRGTVKARDDSAEAGGTGPWLYLYWTNDKGKVQQFSFESYSTQARFEEFCLSLVPDEPQKEAIVSEVVSMLR